jgi:exo-beta-1,3-glucanase (GH17 family)
LPVVIGTRKEVKGQLFSSMQKSSNCSPHRFIFVALLLAGLMAIDGEAIAGDPAWLRDVSFMAYTPSEFKVINGKPIPASPESIAEDLQVLRPYADGLITYSVANGLADVVGLADKAGFRAVILGIWSPTDKYEVTMAVKLVRQYPKLVRAIVVGNEGLFWKRYTWHDVQKAIKQIRRDVPDVAVTTSEPMVSYLGSPARLGCEDQDFLLPNIHPVFEPWFHPESVTQATEFVLDIEKRLYALCNKFVLIKETGVPSGPSSEGFTQATQSAFWLNLTHKMRTQPHAALAYFEAFDAPWKIEEIARDSGRRDEREAAWGWFTSSRKPKEVVEALQPRSPTKTPAGVGVQ